MEDNNIGSVWMKLSNLTLQKTIRNLCAIVFFPLQQTHPCLKVLCRARNGHATARNIEKSHEMPSIYIQIHHSFQTAVCWVSYFEKIVALTVLAWMSYMHLLAWKLIRHFPCRVYFHILWQCNFYLGHFEYGGQKIFCSMVSFYSCRFVIDYFA